MRNKRRTLFCWPKNYHKRVGNEQDCFFLNVQHKNVYIMEVLSIDRDNRQGSFRIVGSHLKYIYIIIFFFFSYFSLIFLWPYLICTLFFTANEIKKTVDKFNYLLHFDFQAIIMANEVCVHSIGFLFSRQYPYMEFSIFMFCSVFLSNITKFQFNSLIEFGSLRH